MKKLIATFTIIEVLLFSMVYAQGVPQPKIPQTTTEKQYPYCESGNCINGWGKEIYNNGYYEGFFRNGNRDGYGLFKWTTSGRYLGFWQNDELHGYGCYIGKEKNPIGEYSNG